MTTIDDLPAPTKSKLISSQALSAIIRDAIAQAGGRISFANFMELALYHPEFGYYMTDAFALGKAGDFTTAPEISPLFSRAFAHQVVQIGGALGTHNVLELGAGTGQFAVDFLQAMQQLNALPEQYFIYEISPALRQKQQDFLRAKSPEFFPRMTWLPSLPVNFHGTIIANEVLDALPVHCFRVAENGIEERCVIWENDHLAWQLVPATPEMAQKAGKIAADYALPAGYESEINLSLPTFLQAVTSSLAQGVILFADYGYGQQEYYHPARSHGTLTCFYQHKKHENPLILPGLQDITAHVDFTQLIETAAEQACSLQGFTTQAGFLLGNGLMESAAAEEKDLTPLQAFQMHQAIKLLTLPSEMGEVIKVMALSKNLDLTSLQGFELQDRRRDL